MASTVGAGNTGDIIMRSVSLDCGYRNYPVLKNICVNIHAGEILSVIGPNGAGKTTLFRTLCGELPALAGSVLIKTGSSETSITSLSRRFRAALIARVLQSEIPAWSVSVKEYIEAGFYSQVGVLGSVTRDQRLAMEGILELLQLTNMLDRTITLLSGGEFRRVLIARALIQNPRILLLDEPVANLDLAWQASLLKEIRTLSGKKMAIIISIHDLNLASMVSDRVLLLASSGIKALGSPREVITHDRIQEVYGHSVMVQKHPLMDIPHVIHLPDWGEGAIEKD